MKKKVLALATISAVLALATVLTPAVASAGGWGSFGHHGWRGDHRGGNQNQGAVVSIEQSPYGPVLVVGGKGAGYDPTSSMADPQGYLFPPGSSLYMASIDPSANQGGFWGGPYAPGCNATTSATAVIEGGPQTCTGSETDSSADWPAFTTNGPPVAGPGVNPWLLGSVYRADLGTFQVTYGGHPLYLFDPGPNSFAGEDFFETAGPDLFPWETAWYLVGPNGQANAGPANLSVLSSTTGTDFTGNTLAVQMLPNIGLSNSPPNTPVVPGVPVAVYTFSGDRPWHSNCYGACAREFIPVTTVGAPMEQSGVNTGAVGVIWRADGQRQVTYHGQPLYIYNQEQPLPLSQTDIVSVGNGNGVSGFGGTLSLVSP